MNGKNALLDLAKKVSEDENWRHLPIEEQEKLLQQLWDRKEKKSTKSTLAQTGNDIEYTLVQLNAEVSLHLINLNNTEYYIPPNCQPVPSQPMSHMVHIVMQQSYQ
jgi:hypothetical protein